MMIIILTLALTTTMALLIGVRGARSWHQLGETAAIVVECIGACTLFVLLNLGIGVALVVAIRALTPWFVSLYDVSSTLFVVVSAIQGFVLHLWYRSAPR